jgi:TRAP-type C4-dicarboxylate transport system permease small subunit
MVFLYGKLLLWIEWGLVVVLTSVVVTLSMMSLISSSFGVDLGDGPTIQTVTYALCFYLCLFGAVIATRRASHIGVDAVTPHLKPAVRLRVEGGLQVVAGVAAVWLGLTAWAYTFETVQEDARFVPGTLSDWFLTQRWVWPTGLCFFWIAFHFFVGGLVRVFGKSPSDLGLAAPTHTEEAEAHAHELEESGELHAEPMPEDAGKGGGR